MSLLLDSFWRAAAYCVHPRVIALSFLPLVLMVALSLGLGYLYWQPAIDGVRAVLESSDLFSSFATWLQGMGLGNLLAVLAPLIVIFAVTPVIVLLSLVVVAVAMTPSLVSMVAERRFATLQRKKGGSLLLSVFWSLGSTLLAAVALVVSMPLWLVPPLILVLPPLIWGWLTYRVFTYDALSEHATPEERRTLMRRHRSSLLAMGVLSGYVGAAPSLLWASGAMFIALAPLLVPIAIWVYTLVFAFASLWFAHYCLAALERLRQEPIVAPVEVVDVPAVTSAAPPAAPASGPPPLPPPL